MPTLPLHGKPSHPDAWHEVRAPGGYEWWYFDADDPEHDRHFVAILFQGLVFHPQYLRRYFRYRRSPTRVAPPVPAEYPAAYFVMYEAGRIRRQFMTQFSSGDFSARSDRLQVEIGRNRICTRDDGAIELAVSGTPWELTWRGPRLLATSDLAASVTFSPRFSRFPVERALLSPDLCNVEHRWVVADPLCDVHASISIDGQSIDFRGRGYHDHNYGTGPFGSGLARWVCGRVLLPERAVTFHYAQPRDPALPREIHLFEADATSTRTTEVSQIVIDWSARTGTGLAYPRRLALDDALVLTVPRVIDSSPFRMRINYNARCRGEHAAALCEVSYPQRLRWPVLGRMIELSIDRRPASLAEKAR
jgi:carotenoid 1,2-hydratase